MQNANKHIIVCDDCAVNCFLIQTMLEIEGYQVDTATSGNAVLAKIEFERPDLLLLDVTMPDIDGYEVVRRIQQNKTLQSLPILMITGHEEEFIEEKLQEKVVGIIRKPVTIDLLVKKVQAALQLDLPLQKSMA
ncbi:response regulator [Fortiea sp. LEGE XX443]|uniref:response regulator n=1 Tax=Fortiea sp. LEGE XX443 TaxID=1828611 RepID=UPI0018803AE3|nr:response regulator [Fortiea sp. LEGE XX443]MBE9005011.1 response regulator [Fortiea sp. LEGE XX443]